MDLLICRAPFYRCVMFPVVLVCLLISVSCGAQVKFGNNLNAEKVLLKMWEKVCFSTAFLEDSSFFFPPEPPTAEELTAAVNSADVDYLKSKCFKTDFTNFPVLSSDWYDREHGGAMEGIRQELELENTSVSCFDGVTCVLFFFFIIG
jgi:hypothetical protein